MGEFDKIEQILYGQNKPNNVVETATSNEDFVKIDSIINNRPIKGMGDFKSSGADEVISAIVGKESGGNYNAVNPYSGASGIGQIMPDNWGPWAEEAGIGRDAEQTPDNQDRVVRFKLGQYMQQFGDPKLAAVAWYAGPDNAKRLKDGYTTLIGDNGQEYSPDARQANDHPSVNEYANDIIKRMGISQPTGSPEGDMFVQSYAGGQVPEVKASIKKAGVLDGIERGAKAGFSGVVGGIADFADVNLGVGKPVADYFEQVSKDNAKTTPYSASDRIPFVSDYWTNPEGAAYDIGQTVGSSAALLPVTAAIGAAMPATAPVTGAVGLSLAARSAAGMLGKAGMQRLGIFAEKVGEKLLTEPGIEFVKWGTAGALGKIPEAASEGGNIVGELREAGYSDVEIRKIANKLALENIPLLMAEGAIEMTGLTGKLGKAVGVGNPKDNLVKTIAKNVLLNVPIQSVTEGGTELKQTMLSEEATGKKAGSYFSPSTWTPEEQESLGAGLVGGGFFGGVGAVNSARQNRTAETNISNEPPAANQPTATALPFEPLNEEQSAKIRTSAMAAAQQVAPQERMQIMQALQTEEGLRELGTQLGILQPQAQPQTQQQPQVDLSGVQQWAQERMDTSQSADEINFLTDALGKGKPGLTEIAKRYNLSGSQQTEAADFKKIAQIIGDKEAGTLNQAVFNKMPEWGRMPRIGEPMQARTAANQSLLNAINGIAARKFDQAEYQGQALSEQKAEAEQASNPKQKSKLPNTISISDPKNADIFAKNNPGWTRYNVGGVNYFTNPEAAAPSMPEQDAGKIILPESYKGKSLSQLRSEVPKQALPTVAQQAKAEKMMDEAAANGDYVRAAFAARTMKQEELAKKYEEVNLEVKIGKALERRDYPTAISLARQAGDENRAQRYEQAAKLFPVQPVVAKQPTAEIKTNAMRQAEEKRFSYAYQNLSEDQQYFIDVLRHYGVTLDSVADELRGERDNRINEYATYLSNLLNKTEGAKQPVETKSGDTITRTYSMRPQWALDKAKQLFGKSSWDGLKKADKDYIIKESALDHLRNGFTDPYYGETVTQEMSAEFNVLEATIREVEGTRGTINRYLPEWVQQPKSSSASGNQNIRQAAEQFKAVNRETGSVESPTIVENDGLGKNVQTPPVAPVNFGAQEAEPAKAESQKPVEQTVKQEEQAKSKISADVERVRKQAIENALKSNDLRERMKTPQGRAQIAKLPEHIRKALDERAAKEAAQQEILEPQTNPIQTPTIENNSVNEKAFARLPKHEVVKTKHTKTGQDLWVVKLKERVDKERFTSIRNDMKSIGGVWSSFTGGFNFTSDPVTKQTEQVKAEAQRPQAQEPVTKPTEESNTAKQPTIEESALTKQPEAKSQEQQKPVESQPEPQVGAGGFDSSQANRDRLRDKLLEKIGKKPPEAKKLNIIDDSDEKLKAELEILTAELSNLSANPVFNTRLMGSAFKVGAIYLQRGANNFADWSVKMIDAAGEKIRPFLPSSWAAINSWPQDVKYDDDIANALFEYVGVLYQDGTTNLADIEKIITEELGKEYLPMVESVYNGIKEWPGFSKKEGEQGERGGRQGIQGMGTQEKPRGSRRMANGEPAGEGTVSVLESKPSKNDEPSGEIGDSEGIGSRSGTLPVRSGTTKHDGGDAANGRKGRSRKGLADAGARGRGESRTEPSRANYHIDDPESLIGGTPKVRFSRNKAAIEALNAITEEGREPSKDELDSMAAYIGWGSFGQELFQGTWTHSKPKAGWETEDKWIRDHLGKEAWESAQRSIINAHYTDPPTVQAMWDMVRAMGFTGGRVLEPSMGIGNFFGMMPLDLDEKSELTGIELDSTTGGMAKILYPEANIQIKGYQESKTSDNFYDLVIGNWPFAKDGPADRRYAKLDPSLHDYFFLKAIDQVHPGGIVIGITSAGTMDKKGRATRMEMAKKAELITAYRLPSGAFEKYAGTKVVTDIIVLRKRDNASVDILGDGWIDLSDVRSPNGQEFQVNEYYVKNPDHILGQLNYGSGSTYGRPSMIVNRPDNIMELLQALPDKVPADAYRPYVPKTNIRYVTNNTTDRQGSITIGEDGNLYVVSGEQLAALEDVSAYRLKDERKNITRESQIRELIKMRRSYGALIDAEREGLETTEKLRKELRIRYQSFVNKYGTINGSDGLKTLEKVKDPFCASLAALEHNGKPSLILSEPTVRSKKKLSKPGIRDAFVIGRNESMDLNVARIAEIAGKSEEETVAELEKADAIYRTPAGNYEVADVYLSGNVRRKLREAQDAYNAGQKSMGRNIEALKNVLPKTVPYFQIEAKLGAPWVKHEHYRQFVAEMLGVTNQDDMNNISVRFINGSWKVKFDNAQLNWRPEATTQWGVEDYKFDKLTTAAMNNVAVRITYKDEDGNTQVDEKATKQANDKITRIREEFTSWAWKDPERRIWLEENYNETMNAVATPQFDGSFLEFAGMALKRGSDQFSLRKHQVDAIWRGLANGRGIYAHEVGTGKTYTMGGIAVESRRYGLARKPLIFAHNANSATVSYEINEMYPGAKILYVDNLAPDQIDITMRKIANDDWDAVVVPHSLIDRFALTRETLMEIAAEEIAALEQEAIDAAAEDNVDLDVDTMDDEEAMKKVRSSTAKQLVHARNQIIKNIDSMAMKASKEGAVPFEDLGIDMVIVDEAHEFKKPPITTKMQMRGLNKGTSNKSIALRLLTDYVKRRNGGRGVHVFTGTPITNTLAEIYNMMRYVMDDQMARDGIKDWDTWFSSFADSTSDVELTASGEYEPVTRLAAFVNVAELRRMAGQYMDIVFADDMPEFKPRPTKSGKTLTDNLTESERDELLNGRNEKPVGRPYKKVVTDVGPMGRDQKAILEELVRLSRKFKNATKKDRRAMMLSGDPSSPVIVETNAANAGMDPRLVDMNAEDDPNSKVNRAVRNIKIHYNEHPKSTQVIFMERGFSSESTRTKTLLDGSKQRTKVERFNLVKDIIAKLVASGIPRQEIAVVDGSTSKEARKRVADAMNEGRVRVVIGNTKTLGVGVNMQTNLRAIHHMDAPWMPGDLEQRNGRGHRQGNKWNTVLEYRYITEKLDGRRWQVLAVKDRFIKAFLKADESVRVIDGDAVSMDEDGEAGDLAATLSEAAGDPRILIREKLKTDISKLENRERMHSFGITDAKAKIKELENKIKRRTGEINAMETDNELAKKSKERDFSATVDGKTYTTRKETDEALAASIKELRPANEPTALADIHGFTLYAKRSFLGTSYYVARNGEYGVEPSVASVEGKLRGLAKRVEELRRDVAESKSSIDRLKEVQKQPFAQESVLKKKRDMLGELERDLQSNPVPPPSWLRHGAPVGTLIYVDGKALVVEGHKWGDTDYYVATEKGNVPYTDAKDENGLNLYLPQPFDKPVQGSQVKESEVSKNERAADTISPLSSAKFSSDTAKAYRTGEAVRGAYNPSVPDYAGVDSLEGVLRVMNISFDLKREPMPKSSDTEYERGFKSGYYAMSKQIGGRPLEDGSAWHAGYYNGGVYALIERGDIPAWYYNRGVIKPQKYSAEVKPSSNTVRVVFGNDLTTEEQSVVQLATSLGTKAVVIVDPDSSLRGYYKNGTLYLNRNGNLSMEWTLGHEFTHWLAENKNGIYKAMRHALGLVTDTQVEAYRNRLGERGKGMNKEAIIEEMVGDEVGNGFGSNDLWEKLEKKSPTLFQRIVQSVREWLLSIVGGSEAKRDSGLTDKQIAQIEAILPDVLREALETNESKYAPSKTAPKNTVKAYKLFRIDQKQPGKLFPLFVYASEHVPIGEWVDAIAGPLTDKGKVQSKLGPLAYRPGWHSGDLPIATHIGGKSTSDLKKPDYRPNNQVWAEIEVPNDVDWQTEANRRGTNDKGKLIPVKAHITDRLPIGGHYRYKTNPNMTGNWLISGSMRINRILTDEEVRAINDTAGVSDLPRLNATSKDGNSFAQQLDAWASGKMNPRETLTLGKTPDVLLHIGAKQLPIEISQKTVTKIVNPAGQEGGKHGIPLEVLKQLPLQLSDPIMVFNSATQPNSLVVLTELLDSQNRSIVAAIALEREHGRHIVNAIASVYGRSSEIEFVKRQIKEGRLLYQNKEKSREWLRSREATVASGAQTPNHDSINSILQQDTKDVNDKDVRYSKDETDSTQIGASATQALDHLAEKLGMKTADRVEIRQQPAPERMGAFSRWYNSVNVLAKKHPKLTPFFRLATMAMETQENLRNHFAHRIEKWEKALKASGDYKKNKADLYQLLLSGDMDGKDFTSAELTEIGMSPNVVAAYRMVRTAMDHAYRLANEVRQGIETKSENMTGAKLDKLRNNKFAEILKVTETGNDNYLVSWKQPKTYEMATIISGEELAELKNNENVQITKEKLYTPTEYILPGAQGMVRGDNFYEVEYIQQAAPISKRGGYIPHFFHDWFVMSKTKDADGKEQFTVMHSAKSMREATQWANEKAATDEDLELVIHPKQFQFPGADVNAAVLGDFDYTRLAQKVSDDLSISLGDARAFLDGKAKMKNRHRFVGNFLERKGAEGYEKNLDWVLKHYFNMVSRYVALDPFKSRSISLFERLFGKFDDVKHDGLADYVRDYINDINGVPSKIEGYFNEILEMNPFFNKWLGHMLMQGGPLGARPAAQVAQSLTGAVAVAKLGLLNISAAAMQITQFANAYALVGNHAIAVVPRAIAPTATDKLIMYKAGVDANMDLTSGAGYSKGRQAKNFIQSTGFMFRYMDTLMRRIAVLGAYDKAREEGKGQPEAILYAKEVNRKANFDYGVSDTPNMFRRGGPIAQLVLQFKKYPIKQLELISELGGAAVDGHPAALMRFLVPYMLLSGLWGFPFLGFGFNLWNIIFGTDKEKELKDFLLKWAGKDTTKQAIAKTIIYGILSNKEVGGVDVSKRVGLGDVMPTRLRDFAGPVLSTIYNTGVEIGRGNMNEALKALSPGLGNVAVALAGETKGARGRTRTKYDETYERIVKGIGFMPIDESTDRDKEQIIKYKEKQRRDNEQSAIDDYIEARQSKDAEKIRFAMKRLRELRVLPARIREEVVRRQKTSLQRTNETVGKQRRKDYQYLQQ